MVGRGVEQRQDLTPEQRERLARDLRTRLWILTGGTVLAVLVVVAVFLLLSSRRPAEPVPWGVVAVAGIGVLVMVVVALRVRSRSTTLERLVLSGDPSTIRRVRRSLSRGEPVADADLDVARALVAQSRSQRSLYWLLGVSAVLNLASVAVSLFGDRPMPTLPLVLRLVGGVGMVLLCLVVWVSRRRLLRGAERAGVSTDS